MHTSILPGSDAAVLRPKAGLFGTFETRPLPELETHGLFYARAAGEFAGRFTLIAMHANGHSCDELAKRLIAAWDSGDAKPAIEQFQYLLRCGGLGRSVVAIAALAAGGW